MKMRPGGHEIENVVTHAPGVLEFLPNVPIQHHRVLNAKEMFIAYGPQNRIESFRAVEVRTETDPTAEEKKRNRAKSITASQTMRRSSIPRPAAWRRWSRRATFTYEEGERKARAAKATLDGSQNIMVLDTGASMCDATGATSADRIRMDQRTGDFTAEGNVRSSRLPDKSQKKKSSEMLSGDEPLHAQARRMESANRNRKIRYEGDVSDVAGRQPDSGGDGRSGPRKAHLAGRRQSGHQPVGGSLKNEQKKKCAAGADRSPRAGHLVYTERTAWRIYRRHRAEPARPAGEGAGTSRLAGRLRMRDSSLEKAFADGDVEILQTSPGSHPQRHRRARRVLYGGAESHSARRQAENGRQSREHHRRTDELTYYANDDRLLVNGSDWPASQQQRQGASEKSKKCPHEQTRDRGKSPKHIVAAAWWTTFRYSCSRAKWWACWDRTARGRPRRST